MRDQVRQVRQVRRVRQVRPAPSERQRVEGCGALVRQVLGCAGASTVVLALAAVVSAQAVKSGKTKTGLAYDIRGKGPVVVLITGSNLDRRMWSREAEWLAPSYTVIRYDLRAHGESDVPKEPFNHGEDVIALLDELEVGKATLIGLSAGASAALDAVVLAPDRVDRVIVAGPGISGYVPKAPAPFFGDLIAALKAGDYNKAGEALLATPVFAAPPESQALVRQMVMENTRLWTVPPTLVKRPARPAIDHLESIKAPTLVLVGEKDIAPIREQADLLAKRVPNARLFVVPDGGHLLNLTSPDIFKTAVLGFLRQ